jgi:hypothetical protein
MRRREFIGLLWWRGSRMAARGARRAGERSERPARRL